MKRLITTILVLFAATIVMAQENDIFKGRIVNDEYDIYIEFDLYNPQILVPGQEVFGEVAGYIGSKHCGQVWPVVSGEILDGNTAVLTVINNYGSEDFTCRLTLNSDSTYSYKKIEGSTLKFPVNQKWQKIPSSVKFKRPEKK